MIILTSAIEGIGGIQTVNRLLLSALRQRNVAASVVSLCDTPDAPWTAASPGSGCAKGSWVRFAAGAVARRAHAFDSVVVTHVGLAPVGRMLPRSSRTRMVAFLYGVEAWRRLPLRTRWGLRRCDLLVAISRHTIDGFREANADLRDIPAEVCYLPARPLPTAAITERKAADTLRVLIVGRMEGRGLLKGQRELIAIWPRVLQQFPNATLYVVGDGAGRGELERHAAAHGVARAVVFPGAVPDAQLDALYASADVFAMPSRGEGFGLVFAEAMTRGVPCIASRLDAGGEVVVDGETGLVIDPAQPEELWTALWTLLADRDLREKMGAAGRRRAAELFSIERFNREICDLIAAAPCQ